MTITERGDLGAGGHWRSSLLVQISAVVTAVVVIGGGAVTWKVIGRPATTTQDWAVEGQSIFAMAQLLVGTVLAWITGIYVWQTTRLVDLTKRAQDQVAEERAEAVGGRRRALTRAALDEIEVTLRTGADAHVMYAWTPVAYDALEAVAREIGPRPNEVAGSLADARRAIRRYNTLASMNNDRISPGHGMLDEALRRELAVVLDTLSANARAHLQNMLAALDQPQASGAQWYD